MGREPGFEAGEQDPPREYLAVLSLPSFLASEAIDYCSAAENRETHKFRD